MGPRFDGEDADFSLNLHTSPRQANPSLRSKMQIPHKLKKIKLEGLICS